MIAIVIKATVVLAAALCAAEALRGRSAALRHAIWTIGLAAVLLLPVSGLLTPSWQPVEIAPLPEIVVSATTTAATGTVPAAPLPWLPILYIAGAALAAIRFLAGAVRVSRMARKGTPSALGAEFGVRVVAAPEVPMPLAWGFFRPLVLLPVEAVAWPAARLRTVLLHEWMHHRRRDLLTQAIAQAACCLYWFHPLAWLALARQRQERERACDDAVLRHGVTPHEYATSLVEVARAMTVPVAAPAMADASTLETRVRAVLDRSIDRRPLTRRGAWAIALLAVLTLAPLATVGLRAQTTAGGTITGVVQDPSGARVPNTQVTARNLDGSNQESAKTGPAGEYQITGIPAGRYAVEFASRGFALRKVETTVVNGAVARLDGKLEVGQVSEQVTVTGRRGTPQTALAPRSPERIRVGGNVTPIRLIRQTRPSYPPEAEQAGVEGTVVMKAVISKTGMVLQPQVINSADARLAKAALDTVSQWIYQPALLNGEPIEVLTTISVEFQLAQ